MHDKLSEAQIRKLLAKPKAYERWVSDSQGLLVRIYPSGTKSFVLQYGRGKRKTIGQVGSLSFRAARDQANSIYRLREEIKVDRDVGRALLTSRIAKKTQQLDSAIAIAEQRDIDPDNVTLKKFLTTYYENPLDSGDKRKDEHRRNFRLAESKRVQSRFPEFVNLPITKIDLTLVETWAHERKSQVSNNTIKRDIASLRAALTEAADTEIAKRVYLLNENPLLSPRARRRLKLQVLQKKPRALDDDQQKRLRAALDQREKMLLGRLTGQHARRESLRFYDHIKPMILLALNTGMRRGEIFSLKWAEVDVTNPASVTVLAFTAKTNTERAIWLNGEAVEILSSWKSDQEKKDQPTHNHGFVFTSASSETGRLCTIKSAWKTLRKFAEIPDLRLHDLRHTFATNLVKMGLDLPSIQHQLGHSNIRMTDLYVKASDDSVRQRLEEIWKEDAS